MSRPLQALAVLLLFGVIKLPVDRAATQYLQKAHLLSKPIDLGLRENIGQMSLAASLGGLRSLIASITYLEAYEEWKKMHWEKVDKLFQLTTRLQPRFARYWDEASWHMAYNAASSYQSDEELRPALREKLYQEHVQRGIDILNDGLKALSENPMLLTRLAAIYDQREHDPRNAADCYLRAYKVTHNSRLARFAGYQYFQTDDPALWRKAYDLLKAEYNLGHTVPTLINDLKILEERLNIPASQRIPEAAIPVPSPARKR